MDLKVCPLVLCQQHFQEIHVYNTVLHKTLLGIFVQKRNFQCMPFVIRGFGTLELYDVVV